MPDPKHLVDLIGLVRPKAVLLTTYTFSVSHFDAVMLPAMRAVGCQDISVLVDADEAQAAAHESQSRAAGRVYRVATARAPGGGVFHPKLAYLAGEGSDVLAVGSGNLTASGQSLQLESFDCVSSLAAPGVFDELAQFMELLAASLMETSPQAAVLLRRVAARARQSARAGTKTFQPGPLPPPALIHTMAGTARDALETMFKGEADLAKVVTVLSPFHSPDGGPVHRLAFSLGAKALRVGVDYRRLMAPFDAARFKPTVPASFVVADAPGNNRRLHAKVFELQTEAKVLVMSGSVNATAQSFESTRNVEVSLARWLRKSSFQWKDVEPHGYQITQEQSDFKPKPLLQVDAWLATDRVLHGRLASRGDLPKTVHLALLCDDQLMYEASGVEVGVDGAFSRGSIPAFDTSRATLLTVSAMGASTTCWLNVNEELEMAAEERERRSAISRVLRGNYEQADVAQLIHMLSVVAQGVGAAFSARAARPSEHDGVENSGEAEADFSFMHWGPGGRGRSGVGSLARNPYEILRALNRWMNSGPIVSRSDEAGEARGATAGSRVQMLGATEAEAEETQDAIDTYALLDRLCLAIPIALERHPDLEHATVLAEVVASRALGRAETNGLGMDSCISWLDRFSRYSYTRDREQICAVATAMACLTAYRLGPGGVAHLSVLRESVERFRGSSMDEQAWIELAAQGFARETYQRVNDAQRLAALTECRRLASATTLDDSVLAIFCGAPSPSDAVQATALSARFPDVVSAWQRRRRSRAELQRGILNEAGIARGGCPMCYLIFRPEEITALRRKHVLLHACNKFVFYSEHPTRLIDGLSEAGDA